MIVDKKPFLLLRNGEFLDDSLARTPVTRDDIRAKIRQANVPGIRVVSC